jgi:TPR repeat protein
MLKFFDEGKMRVSSVSLRRFAAPLLLALILGACSSSADKPKPKSNAELRQDTVTQAMAGDADAQYRLGYDLCCGQGDARGKYDVALATQWLCRAAHQNNARAQYRLGMIYAGNLVESGLTARLLRQVISSNGPKPQPRLAAMWLDLAMASGHEQAGKRRIDLTKQMEAADHIAVEKMRAKWRSAPCEWNTVHGITGR